MGVMQYENMALAWPPRTTHVRCVQLCRCNDVNAFSYMADLTVLETTGPFLISEIRVSSEQCEFRFGFEM